ncbi:MAG: hypothetical protein QOK33_1654 [Mycobacterium sp.]|nr:hypothetical protein [Mycobacterium sp.]
METRAIALSMGLRRGEALGLAWTDVDLDGGRLTVRQALHRVDGQPRLDPVKTDASVAVLPIPAPLVSILTAHRRRQREERIAAGSCWRDTGLVFTTAHSGFIEPRNANRMFHDVCTKAKVPQLRVHDLRHSCATLLFTMGVQPATVQRILRHSSITVTTGTYVEVIEAVQRDALDSMGSLFRGVADTASQAEYAGSMPVIGFTSTSANAVEYRFARRLRTRPVPRLPHQRSG